MTAFKPPKPNHRSHNASFLGRVFSSNRDMLENYTEKAYSYLMGRNNMGLGVVYAINCLDSVKTVLIDESKNFPKSDVMFRALEPLLGRSVFSVNGEEWEAQRRRLAPAFAHLHVKRGFPEMRNAVERMLCDLERVADTGETIDVDILMMQAASDVIFRVMFSESLDTDRGNVIYNNFQIYQAEQKYFSIRTLINWPKWVPWFGNRHNRKAMKAAANIRNAIFDIVHTRLAMKVEDRPEDMLTAIMVEYTKDFGDDLPVVELVDQIALFFFAGHETTAAATCWALYLLAESPEEEAKLVKEIQDVVGDREIEFSDIKNLRFTDACFKEAIRLYPPVPYFPRKSEMDIKIRTHELKPGSQCTINAYFIHRNTRWWEDADLFIPDRFMEKGGCPENKLGYIPFSAGPRICPGANFAAIESTLMIASVFRRYKLKTVEGHKVETHAQLTLRTKNGVLVTVTKR